MTRREQLSQFSRIGIMPIVFAAFVIWLFPLVAPGVKFPLVMQSFALVYSGAITIYLAGIGAGNLISVQSKLTESFLPGIVVLLVTGFALWTNLPFNLDFPIAWRQTIILIAFIYVSLRDVRAVDAGAMPAWYSALRTRFTLWVGLSLIAIIARQIVENRF